MRIRKPPLALAALAAVLCALALATPAHATSIKAVCVVNGEAKTEDKDDPTLGVRLVGGKGRFWFHEFVLFCAGMKDGVPEVHLLGTRVEGVYETVVCGTGKTTGTITELFAPLKYELLMVGKKFTIHFFDRAGYFFWHDSAKPSIGDFKSFVGDQTPGKESTPKAWEMAGTARLEGSTWKLNDPPADPSRNHCMKAFTVTAVVVIDEDDGQGPVPKFP